MKKHLLFLFFYLAMLQSGMSQLQAQLDEFKASALIFQSKYYKANVWDVFRSPADAIAGYPWNLFNFNEPYDALTRSRINWGADNDRYLAFDLVESSTGIYVDDLFSSFKRYSIILKLYEADGRYVKDICEYGVLMGFGDKGFLFTQNYYYGTFFANDAYTTGNSITYTPTTGRITKLSEIKRYSHSPQLVKPSAAITTFAYNGQLQQVTIAASSMYTISGTVSAVDVGDYTVTVTLNDKTSTTWADATTDDVTINWSITKGTYDMRNADWDFTEPFTWDGTPKTVSVTGLPSGVTVDGYTGNMATSPGTYNAIATLAYDQNNYNAPVMPELNWSIKQLEVAKPNVNAGSFIYNGDVQAIDIAVSNHYSVTGVISSTNAGDFSARVSLNNKEASVWTDGTNDDIIILWSISKASYNMSAVKWIYSEPFIWDGTPKTVLVTGLPSGVSVHSYFENSATPVGTYTATALLNYDELNYHEPAISSLNWEIKPGYTNLNIIKLWNNVLAVSNGDKYDDIRNASYNWYRNGVLLQGNQQYISFEGDIPAGSYLVEIIIDNQVALSLDYVVQSGTVAIAYPNPVQTGRSLVVELGEERPAGEQAQVLNTSGYPVKASVEPQTTGYRISGISAPGTYFVHVFTAEQTTTTLKIIVN